MANKKWFLPLIFCSLVSSQLSFSQGSSDLELLDAKDLELLEQGTPDLDISEIEEVDDLESLKNDVGENVFNEKKEKNEEIKKDNAIYINDDVDFVFDKENSAIVNEGEKEKGQSPRAPLIFDVGQEEKKLLEISKFLETKIPDTEWEEISNQSKEEKYVVQEGDYLWKISESLFGSGFYYSKIWAMNPHITNPHEIEPGMVLVFNSGTSDEFPNVSFGEFENAPAEKNISKKSTRGFNLDRFGDESKPGWLEERQKLIDQGVFFQFASEETFDDLRELGEFAIRDEYRKYEPPVPEILIQEPGDEYDASGFDRASKIEYEVKEGFFLNSFLTTNVVQDLGTLTDKKDESIFVKSHEKVFVEFDKGVKVKPGDRFSIYTPEGKSSHPISDRTGYKYNIAAQIKAVRKQNNKWECLVTNLTGLVQRGARVTIFTPKIDKILQTFNRRSIEAAIIDSYRQTADGISFGDVVYIDRGRADGVEMGNVFEIYSFVDKGTDKRITPDPTYKIGELTVITLTDNFATALVTNSRVEIPMGSLALAKTEEQALREAKLKGKGFAGQVENMEARSLEELDVELNLNNLGDDLLDRVDKIQLTEDELQELERQEREKSVIKEHEKDLKELERLEGEIIDAEKSLNEAKVDEDKFLEQQDLDTIENNQKKQDANAFESVNDIEKEIGRKYLDQDLNEKENPYGLTEFDLEEIDELLNTEE
ncbi:LysM peptidoglycan-binding domain-containing protein [Halobacteriovorax sp. GB3]|uniref:LysM peptidoglycan-binding domain-containing protein n=1 Tax=Halobacteriovorax sp. GB3 TaxID=2719615 RepID=UPI0023627536|nr:LysM peptidoglycan-binding domain-containing protein [Halobacteriovorax sp. GB3]MDD0853752.1 LysM peptidoglycan-binding domain-containing protein [Halobacteriovorax sp. GB3]